MNTKLLMTSSSLILGSAGVFALFMPDVLLSTQGAAVTGEMSVLVQLLGSLYFSFALMNWAAKDSLIGGIYARPVSLANFAHFFVGTLLLLRYQLSNEPKPVHFGGVSGVCGLHIMFLLAGVSVHGSEGG